MRMMDATEQAYKNGYAAGLKAAERRAKWEAVCDNPLVNMYRCSACGYVFARGNYCTNCGARMEGIK